MNLGTQSITLLQPGDRTKDEFGNWVDGPPVEVPVTGCSVQPAPGGELLGNRDQLTTAYIVWMPMTPRVNDYAQVVFDGDTYELDGPVERWAVGSPLDHQVLNLRRRDG